MNNPSAPPPLDDSDPWDVIVVGGALSGAATAWLLRERNPGLRILIVERSSQFKRRVGEATVEMSALFLTRILGLQDHLLKHHLIKQGLRFWFMNEHTTGFDDCSEIGPGYNVRLTSFQVDRAVLDSHLLERCEAAGITVWRPATVTSFELEAGGLQRVEVEAQGQSHRLTARWLVDASGLASLVARKNGWRKLNTAHPTASAWTRWQGVADWDAPGLRQEFPKYGNRAYGMRQTATNHLIGKGWWSWWIPLHNGDTSVGVVWDERICSFDGKGASIPDRLRAHLETHPMARRLLRDAAPVERDSNYRRPLAYCSEQTMGDGFALVGDAAAFLDPFYSPGMDWIAFTTIHAADAISRERAGETVGPIVAAYAAKHQVSYRRWFDGLYRDKYYYMGDFELMRLAFLLDLGTYYFGVVSQPFKYGAAGFDNPPLAGPHTAIPAWILRTYNRRLAAIGRSRMRRGTWGRHNHGRYAPFDSYTFDARLIRRLLGNFACLGGLEAREGWRTRSADRHSPVFVG